MKKILSIVLIFGTMCLFSTSAFAVDSGTGSITLTDTNGKGPGVANIDISAKGCAAYSAAVNAGGYTTGTAGKILCIITGSSAADKNVALYFGVRNSEDKDYPEDNNVYQKSTLTDPTDPTTATDIDATKCANLVNEDLSDTEKWHVRGGGGSQSGGS